ncbi:hypothetical protein [Uliginosibacterium sp. TH139]|jgi:hypothetical protein|uniref:hypothetical protein n=1 Tax=Uliginosibacterium sp. TH139 TaxID=2067453 RepID=UPI000C7AC3C4|nr:hypothetical protein [Uliginosibacterium sp. TH139]PLK50734.1 hypothetical protein C0V76_02690 [Uliginosibacterium sp. TH139]
MSKKLHERSVKQAERTLWVSVAVGVVCLAFVLLGGNLDGTGKQVVGGLIVAILAYQLVRRFTRGPLVGVAIIEVLDGFLYFRNPASRPMRVDRIALEKIHSIRLMGEDRLRYFDCKLMNGDLAHIGPFERGQGELVIAEWFYQNLPETPFIVDTSATVFEEMQRPPGL